MMWDVHIFSGCVNDTCALQEASFNCAQTTFCRQWETNRASIFSPHLVNICSVSSLSAPCVPLVVWAIEWPYLSIPRSIYWIIYTIFREEKTELSQRKPLLLAEVKRYQLPSHTARVRLRLHRWGDIFCTNALVCLTRFTPNALKASYCLFELHPVQTLYRCNSFEGCYCLSPNNSTQIRAGQKRRHKLSNENPAQCPAVSSGCQDDWWSEEAWSGTVFVEKLKPRNLFFGRGTG